MDSDLRRALWATARIAGLGVLVGCAPQVGVVIPENPVPTSQDVPDEPIDEEPTCAELFKDLNERAEAGEDTRNPDEGTAACCEALIDEIDETGIWPEDDLTQRAQWSCCSALDWPQSMACTPWGPPAPPRMPAPAARAVA